MSNQVKNPDFCQTPLKNAAFDSVPPSNPVKNQFYFDGTDLKIWTGSIWKVGGGIAGAPGQSAYQAAVVGGYTETEAVFYTDLAAMSGLAAFLEGLL